MESIPSGSSGRGGWRERGAGSSSRGSSRGPSRGGYSKPTQGKKESHHPPLTGPLHDAPYIETTYKTKSIKPEWLANPKSPLTNYMLTVFDQTPHFQTTLMSYGDSTVWRSTVIVPETAETIIGTGDSPHKKEAERLAALCALYIIDGKGLRPAQQQSGKTASPGKLSDGTIIDFDRARQFMDYYCRRFDFRKPEITYETKKHSKDAWEAIMAVDGKRIGIGSGVNKKAALANCYVDVTVYLEDCDPALWRQFVEDAKTGKDLGLAATVLFSVPPQIEERLQNLCAQVGQSTLYRNWPKAVAPVPVSTESITAEPATSVYVAPNRRAANDQSLQAKSVSLLERQQAYLEDPQLEEMRKTRESLPVYTKSKDVLAHIENNDVTILMAATGSGKTTQIPQLILDQWIARGDGAKCNILCTQPRRIAAISVAGRVAAERGEPVGRSVGYQVRFEAKLPARNGSLTFCTTGIFLKRMHTALEAGTRENNLDDVTHVVVDEVHERDVDTDLLLVVLKRLLEHRRRVGKPLKIILMSATIDPTLFQQYFPDTQGKPAGVIEVPGRSFPVEKHFMDSFIPDILSRSPAVTDWLMSHDAVRNYLAKEVDPSSLPPQAANRLRGTNVEFRDEDLELPYPLIAYTVTHILKNSKEGHVLVFLPGWDEITNTEKWLKDPSNPFGLSSLGKSDKFQIHLLHSTIPVVEQQAIFDPPPAGVRRIILATNIAETSVTIPDVVYVVDSGKVKEQRYDPERRISSLVSAWVGTSNLNQRAGRAGRHRPGVYYGLLGERRLGQLHAYQTVEMKRVDLTNVVMHVKALNFPGVTVEEVLAASIEPPAEERVLAAIQSLKMVGALDEQTNLTSLGRVLLQLPIEPQMGRLVLYGAFFRCLDEALTLAAILTNRDPFMSPMHLKDEAAKRKKAFSPDEFRSDALTVLRAYRVWWSMQSRGEFRSANQFCVDNFLSKPTLLMIQKVKGHILQSLYDAGIFNVAARGDVANWVPRRGDATVPPELNVNGESMPLLTALITIALQPKFAIRTGDKTLRTNQDKIVLIHPSSVNSARNTSDDAKMQFLDYDNFGRVEKQLIAFVEKRQNLSSGATSGSAQKFIVNTTYIDPLTYILFGAYHLQVIHRGIICDDWLPIVGRMDTLGDVERLKTLMEACILRVFQGITLGHANNRRGGRRHVPISRREEREEESGDEDEDVALKDYSLTTKEIHELDEMTHDIVGILNDYGTYRIANQSRVPSRAATPSGSPTMPMSRLALATRGGLDWPSLGRGPNGGSRSGYSTPYHTYAYFMSRPGTPSRLR
ncbi:P-loop containing nucleoside triphosphate hydrolase protein [Cristinia sonorae]|uniref:P-loop containing nucleoside triphosphate hydrolase protein n=1 Tax=Cristinia sonorae TaxID=1940300 RepID=A0A8K0XQ44_9AGAR|nr:P-loop containing nucleoside triphosphate hydrolase protein [Cristinia sonorae]